MPIELSSETLTQDLKLIVHCSLPPSLGGLRSSPSPSAGGEGEVDVCVHVVTSGFRISLSH